jgi:hypothetical protein
MYHRCTSVRLFCPSLQKRTPRFRWHKENILSLVFVPILVIDWVQQKGKKLPDAIAPENIPDVGEWDELETFVGSKTQDLGVDSSGPFP